MTLPFARCSCFIRACLNYTMENCRGFLQHTGIYDIFRKLQGSNFGHLGMRRRQSYLETCSAASSEAWNIFSCGQKDMIPPTVLSAALLFESWVSYSFIRTIAVQLLAKIVEAIIPPDKILIRRKAKWERKAYPFLPRSFVWGGWRPGRAWSYRLGQQALYFMVHTFHHSWANFDYFIFK